MKKAVLGLGILALASLVPVTAGAIVELGHNDRRITFTGPFSDPDFDATQPFLLYNPDRNDFFLIWKADDSEPGPTPPLQVNDEEEIFGQLLNAEAEPAVSPFVISKSGPPGDPDFDAELPRAAYNSAEDQYLVVWRGEDIFDDDVEIFGRLMNADGTGASVFFPVSAMGAPGDTNAMAQVPAVAYNSVDNEYLVVWSGDPDSNPINTSNFAAFGQRIDKDGNEVGSDDFQIVASEIAGPFGNPIPVALVHNPFRNEYVLLYNRGSLDEGLEMYGVRLAANGTVLGAPFRLSTMGPEGSFDFIVQFGALAFNPDRREYLAVWAGVDDREPLAEDEFEVYGQRFDEDGNEIGVDDFRISDGGRDGNEAYSVNFIPALAYNPADSEYLVVWSGRAFSPFLDSQESEIFGQLLDEEGFEIGENDFRLSDMGPFGDASYGPQSSVISVAHNTAANEYVVAWASDDTGTAIQPQVFGEYEVFVQRFVTHICGDGTVDVHEDCDDGNTDDGDGCKNDCSLPEGEVTGGETSGGETGGETGGGSAADSEGDGGGCQLVR